MIFQFVCGLLVGIIIGSVGTGVALYFKLESLFEEDDDFYPIDDNQKTEKEKTPIYYEKV